MERNKYVRIFLIQYVWLVGLVAWFSLRVREVPGSTPGQAQLCYICFAFGSNIRHEVKAFGRWDFFITLLVFHNSISSPFGSIHQVKIDFKINAFCKFCHGYGSKTKKYSQIELQVLTLNDYKTTPDKLIKKIKIALSFLRWFPGTKCVFILYFSSN